MASNTETGHAKNAANFFEQLSFITGYGATYNPTKASITLPQMNVKHTAVLNAISAVTAAHVPYISAVNARTLAFQNLGTLSSRIVFALSATDATKELVKDAKTYQRKIVGRRKKAVVIMGPDDPAPNNISVSQRSYTQQLENFTNLVAIAASEPSYAPNEVDLQIDTLNDWIEELQSLNNNVANTFTGITNARLLRNQEMYNKETGLLAVAQESKNYVRSVYGPTAPQTKQLTRIRYKYYKI